MLIVPAPLSHFHSFDSLPFSLNCCVSTLSCAPNEAEAGAYSTVLLKALDSVTRLGDFLLLLWWCQNCDQMFSTFCECRFSALLDVICDEPDAARAVFTIAQSGPIAKDLQTDRPL